MRPEAPSFRRRALSLTPLIDVIFLLLLYFMLSTTFLRHGEITLVTASAGMAAPADGAPVLFVQLRPAGLTLNGRPVGAGALPQAVAALMPPDGAARAILSLDPAVSAQSLADVLVVLQAIAGLGIEVIG